MSTSPRASTASNDIDDVLSHQSVYQKIFQGTWSPTNTDECENAEIRNLADEPVETVDDAKITIVLLVSLTLDLRFVNIRDVNSTGVVLEKIADVKNLTTDVLEGTIAVVNTLIIVTTTYMSDDASPDTTVNLPTTTIPSTVDKIADTIAQTAIENGTESMVLQFSGSRVVITVVITPVDIPVTWPILDLSVGTGVDGCDVDQGTCQTGDSASSDTKVELPILASMLDDSSILTGAVSIVAYDSDVLFGHGSTGGTVSVATGVVAVSISGARESGQFSMFQRVSISLPLLDSAATDNGSNERVCSWYMEGSGTWMQSGCVLDPYQTTDSVAVCSCDHLTSFAVLMDTSATAPAEGDTEHDAALSIIT